MLRRGTIHFRSRAQEETTAADIKGRRQPGSGSRPHSKGDVKGSRFLVENKTTDAQQYPLKLATIRDLQKKALFEQREWCLQVDIRGTRFAVLPYDVLLELEEEHRGRP